MHVDLGASPRIIKLEFMCVGNWLTGGTWLHRWMPAAWKFIGQWEEIIQMKVIECSVLLTDALRSSPALQVAPKFWRWHIIDIVCVSRQSAGFQMASSIHIRVLLYEGASWQLVVGRTTQPGLSRVAQGSKYLFESANQIGQMHQAWTINARPYYLLFNGGCQPDSGPDASCGFPINMVLKFGMLSRSSAPIVQSQQYTLSC